MAGSWVVTNRCHSCYAVIAELTPLLVPPVIGGTNQLFPQFHASFFAVAIVQILLTSSNLIFPSWSYICTLSSLLSPFD